MKNLLFVCIIALALYSCGSNEDEPTPTSPKEFIVNLGFQGEITKIEESPLRATPDDLYGIQVYSKIPSNNEYKPYAYGLFNDKAKMTIKLLEGYQYKFVSTMVIDGVKKIHSLENKYYGPFDLNTLDATGLTNEFVHNTSTHMEGIAMGRAFTSESQKIFSRPNTERYYGELQDYTPSENGSVAINMKRAYFGVKFIAENLSEGTLNIALEGAPPMLIQSEGSSEVESYITFENTYPYGIAWTDDNYTEEIPVIILWEKADGAVVPVVNENISFKRNKLLSITVTVKDNSVENGISITHENTPMGGDSQTK